MSGIEALKGRRILVVEDEYFLADEITEALGEAGAMVVGPLSLVGEALDIARGEDQPDGAVLDVNLAGEMVWPVVDALAARGVSVVIATGYDAGHPACPFAPAALREAGESDSPSSGTRTRLAGMLRRDQMTALGVKRPLVLTPRQCPLLLSQPTLRQGAPMSWKGQRADVQRCISSARQTPRTLADAVVDRVARSRHVRGFWPMKA